MIMNENSILIWLQFGVLWNVWNVWVTVECVERLSVECPWCLRVCGLPGMSLCLWNVWVFLECLSVSGMPGMSECGMSGMSVKCLKCLSVCGMPECLFLECLSVCGMPGMPECLWNAWNVWVSVECLECLEWNSSKTWHPKLDKYPLLMLNYW